MHRGGLPRWSHWPDRATAYTPQQYGLAYLALACAGLEAGDPEAAERYETLAIDWMKLAR